MIKTIILDCDGVMFDSKNANRHYYNFLRASFDKPEMDEAELNYVHIHNVYDCVAHLFRNYPDISLDDVHRFRKNNSAMSFTRYLKMEPDLIPFLEITKEHCNLAIATNRTDTMFPLLKEFGLDDYFGKVMTAENSRKPKPAPDGIYEIMAHFNCSLNESIYVGDSEVDEQTAVNCGIRLIAFKNPKLNADYYVENFLDILKLPPFVA